MFRKKEDPTELELLRIRVRNLEKQVAELKKAPQVQAEEQQAYYIPKNGITLGRVEIAPDRTKFRTDIKTQLDFDGVTTIDKSSIETTTSHVITVVGPMEIKITADGVEVKKAPRVKAEELDDLEVAPILLTLANKCYSDGMKKMLLEWSSAALSVAKSRR